MASPPGRVVHMADRAIAPNQKPPRLRRPGIVILVGNFLAPVIEGALLFTAAGRLDLPRAWLFLGLSFIGIFGGIVPVAIVNPELLNQRGAWKKKKDTKRWDRTLVTLYGLLAFYVLPVVIGLDVGRYRWSHLGLWAAVAGSLLYLVGAAVVTWAMLTNPHFETTVRIQTDRGHKVVTTGPYAFVRHPGYLGAGLWAFATPLIVGSAWGLVPALAAIAVLIIRIHLEERALVAELPGYAEYAQRVRHRLLPGIW